MVCNDTENQFNHVTRDDLYLGTDFEVVSKQMWLLLMKAFCPSDSKCQSLVRSYERIGLGMRTQIEYFY